jgi:hypothetical protein
VKIIKYIQKATGSISKDQNSFDFSTALFHHCSTDTMYYKPMLGTLTVKEINVKIKSKALVSSFFGMLITIKCFEVDFLN